MPCIVIMTLKTLSSPFVLGGRAFQTYSEAREAGLKEQKECDKQGWGRAEFYVRKVDSLEDEVCT